MDDRITVEKINELKNNLYENLTEEGVIRILDNEDGSVQRLFELWGLPIEPAPAYMLETNPIRAIPLTLTKREIKKEQKQRDYVLSKRRYKV